MQWPMLLELGDLTPSHHYSAPILAANLLLSQIQGVYYFSALLDLWYFLELKMVMDVSGEKARQLFIEIYLCLIYLAYFILGVFCGIQHL